MYIVTDSHLAVLNKTLSSDSTSRLCPYMRSSSCLILASSFPALRPTYLMVVVNGHYCWWFDYTCTSISSTLSVNHSSFWSHAILGWDHVDLPLVWSQTGHEYHHWSSVKGINVYWEGFLKWLTSFNKLQQFPMSLISSLTIFLTQDVKDANKCYIFQNACKYTWFWSLFPLLSSNLHTVRISDK